MHAKYFYLLLIYSLLMCSPAAANMADIETAIMRQDYYAAKQLAADVVNFAVVKKDVAFEARYYLGISQLRLEEYNASIEVFKSLIRDKPGEDIRDKAYIGLFEAHYQQDSFRTALKLARKMLKESPKSKYLSLMYLKAARANLRLSRWKKAKYYLNQIIDRFPQSYEYHIAKQLLQEKQYFAVQVGAFVDRSHALNVVDKLTDRNEYAYIVETVDRDKKKFYRVRVGQFSVLNEAEQLKSKLTKLGYPTRIYP